MEEEESLTTTATQYCSNCKKDIPSVNYVMHSSHCSRNITLCQICNEPVPITERDEHFEENHSKVKCDCGESIEKMHLENHKEQDCINRQVACQYCELELPFCEMKSHKDFCGSRTQLCDRCKKYVQQKNFEDHLNSDCLSVRSFTQNNTAQSSRQHERNRIPPEELIQNVNLADGFGFDTETLQRILRVAEGTLPDEHYDTGDANAYGTLYGISNMFPQPRQDVVARGHGNSESRQNIASRRYRNDYDDIVDSDDAVRRYQREEDELAAALLACGPNRQNIASRRYRNDYDDIVDSDDAVRRYQREEDELAAALLACGPNSFESPSYGSNNHNVFEQDIDIMQESVLDQTVLPCEFCGEAIELDQLIIHQTGCQVTQMGAAMPTGRFPNLRSPPRSLPPLPQSLLNNEVGRHIQTNDHDVTLLPCEFCEELISTDMLFAHQSMCDPQRTRPSSVLQAENFYHNEPDIPSWNNSRPRASNRPPRPSRPVVSDRGRENSDFDPVSSNTTPTSSSSRNNRTRSNVSGSQRQSQRATPRETREIPDHSNGSPLTTSTNNIASTRTRQAQNYTSPATENDDSYEIALFRRETSGLQEEAVELAEKMKSKKYADGYDEREPEYAAKNSMSEKTSSGTSKRYSNGIKPRGNDSGVSRPQRDSTNSPKYRSTGSLATKTTSHRNKTSSTSSLTKNQASKEPYKQTQETRKQLTRLAPSFDAKAQSSSDSRQQRINRSVERGLNERRGSTERKDSSKSTSGDKKSKKKFA